MIIVTGGAGFIGSAFVWKLNEHHCTDILIVDDLGSSEKWKNLTGLQFKDYLHKTKFLEYIRQDQLHTVYKNKIQGIIHLGACSSTTQKDVDYLMENNFHYSCELAKWAVKHKIRMIYASSAATYGNGEQGFSDDHAILKKLRPINPYGYSKHLFDLWLQSEGLLDHVIGLKFFNVFGPNEYHKSDMRSMICKAYEQIFETKQIKLFKSYLLQYSDGSQVRDFIYIKDCVEIMWWLYQSKLTGIFNIGTGQERSWNDLAKAIFTAMKYSIKIEYIPMPEELKKQYQYFTKADTKKLYEKKCPITCQTLEDSVADYVSKYLSKNQYLT